MFVTFEHKAEAIEGEKEPIIRCMIYIFTFLIPIGTKPNIDYLVFCVGH